MNGDQGSSGLWIWLFRACLLAAFAALLIWRLAVDTGILAAVAAQLRYALPTGFFAGLVSSATGASGAFVLVPVFDVLRAETALRMNFHQNVATAFLVQSFGMGFGALGWIAYLYGPRAAPADEGGERILGNDLLTIVFATLCTAVPTLIATQVYVPLADRTLQTAYMIFALALGVALLVFTWAVRGVEPTRDRAERFDLYMFFVIGVAGGYVAAFFSVGIGEFLFVYLIFRKFPAYGAVAAAVITAAITVAAGTGYNLAQGRIVWDVALGAIPGAIVGGFLAHWLATGLGSLWVKTIAALWITGSSIFLIVRALA